MGADYQQEGSGGSFPIISCEYQSGVARSWHRWGSRIDPQQGHNGRLLIRPSDAIGIIRMVERTLSVGTTQD